MKTVLISLANSSLFRNIGLFPGSVIDLLGQEKDIRVVVLVKKASSFPFYRTGPNIVIEEVDERMDRNLFQRAFSFFFSYFIFTNTTRLVSSYGVRADKPRPIYRFWNYPIKIFISRVFGPWRWFREVVLPKLYFRIFTNYRVYQAVFEKYRPDLAFLPSVCIWPADLEVLIEAKRQGVPTVGMPGNWDHLSKYFIPFRPDQLLVWSEQVKYEAEFYQFYDSAIIHVVGAPQVDFFQQTEQMLPRANFLEKIGFPPNARVITYASQGPYSLDGGDYVDMLLCWIDEGELPPETRIIVRPHPNGLLEKEKYDRFRGHPLVYMDELEGWSSLENAQNFINVIGQSDIIVTTYSTVATEAAIWDRPTIITSFDGYKNRPIFQSVRRHRNFTHFRDVIATGGTKVTESPREFLSAVKMYLADPSRDADGRARLRHVVFGPCDGKSSARIVQHIRANLFQSE